MKYFVQLIPVFLCKTILFFTYFPLIPWLRLFLCFPPNSLGNSLFIVGLFWGHSNITLLTPLFVLKIHTFVISQSILSFHLTTFAGWDGFSSKTAKLGGKEIFRNNFWSNGAWGRKSWGLEINGRWKIFHYKYQNLIHCKIFTYFKQRIVCEYLVVHKIIGWVFLKTLFF